MFDANIIQNYENNNTAPDGNSANEQRSKNDTKESNEIIIRLCRMEAYCKRMLTSLFMFVILIVYGLSQTVWMFYSAGSILILKDLFSRLGKDGACRRCIIKFVSCGRMKALCQQCCTEYGENFAVIDQLRYENSDDIEKIKQIEDSFWWQNILNLIFTALLLF